ncbi:MULTISPECIES: hypothetical protein [Paenibacillus]|nr:MULTISPECIES: hypothetical protein [Paenibacillus]EGL19324.1 hypothetical protein HMPREF9413_4693 [Paenibacillus sp. HGF7]EPD82539.1 hypothetical protein HMPREF1207_03331 [Paenibacillus sp. HGH0039]SEF81172.1 hypothetical protein SAMN02799616_01066 [Paenibacillus sp. UNC499MF]
MQNPDMRQLLLELEQFVHRVEEQSEPVPTVKPYVDDLKQIMLKHVNQTEMSLLTTYK